eukprot:PLAT6836.1.p2 GENE.PLAT6836.1~~PLAT6836.1.p2  ORF type:complete len:170 (+),score=30.91 PLAT6836.1:252-761(+)
MYPSGSQYSGGMEDHLPSGYGDFWWSTGMKHYEGDWLDGKMHGHGTLHFENGDTWEGRFWKDELHGGGVYTRATGDARVAHFNSSRLVAWEEELHKGRRLRFKQLGSAWQTGTIVRFNGRTGQHLLLLDGDEGKELWIDLQKCVIDDADEALTLFLPTHTYAKDRARPE